MLQTVIDLPRPFLILLFSLVPVIYAIIRAAFDPLRSVPGPFLARFTRLWYFYKVWCGDFELVNVELHKRYGPIVRIAPGQYSFDDVDAARVVYGSGAGFVKVLEACPVTQKISTVSLTWKTVKLVLGLDATKPSQCLSLLRHVQHPSRDSTPQIRQRLQHDLSTFI